MTKSGLRLNVVDSRTNEPRFLVQDISNCNCKNYSYLYFTHFLPLVLGSSSQRLGLISTRCTGKFRVLHDCK
jgi:hypothetical protein